MTKKERKEYWKKYYSIYKKYLTKQKEKYYINNKEKISKRQNEYINNHKEEILKYQKNYRKIHKEQITKKIKQYQQEHKEDIKKYRQDHIEQKKEYDKKYREEHKIELAKYIKNYTKKRMKNDINFRLRKILKTRIYQVLKGINKSARTVELLGCNIEFFREYLQKQFTKGMTWNNYGLWHIDHIRPCSRFDLRKEEEQVKCFNYKNLQPLWAKENILKRDKIL